MTKTYKLVECFASEVAEMNKETTPHVIFTDVPWTTGPKNSSSILRTTGTVSIVNLDAVFSMK